MSTVVRVKGTPLRSRIMKSLWQEGQCPTLSPSSLAWVGGVGGCQGREQAQESRHPAGWPLASHCQEAGAVPGLRLRWAWPQRVAREGPPLGPWRLGRLRAGTGRGAGPWLGSAGPFNLVWRAWAGARALGSRPRRPGSQVGAPGAASRVTHTPDGHGGRSPSCPHPEGGEGPPDLDPVGLASPAAPCCTDPSPTRARPLAAWLAPPHGGSLSQEPRLGVRTGPPLPLWGVTRWLFSPQGTPLPQPLQGGRAPAADAAAETPPHRAPPPQGLPPA